MKLCFATNNKHKLEEVQHAAGDSFEIVSLNHLNYFEELPETSHTLEGNSLQKAQFVFNKFNIPCFADDSGLEVSALNNAPGVYSARYAGDHKSSEDNIRLLLKNLEGIENRKARFRTIITLVGLEAIYVFEGSIEGEILHQPRGTQGFGYDPVFKPSLHNLSFAEMSLAQKNQLSHRAIAIAKLISFLNSSKMK